MQLVLYVDSAVSNLKSKVVRSGPFKILQPHLLDFLGAAVGVLGAEVYVCLSRSSSSSLASFKGSCLLFPSDAVSAARAEGHQIGLEESYFGKI